MSFAVDLTGVLLTFRAAVPHVGAGGGVLLATGSSLAIRPGTGLLPYVAAKAGVHTMCRSLALELAPLGIRVNVVAPGLADTPMTAGIPGHIERQLPSVPLGRLVEVSDVAALAVHLMTDDAGSVTGSVFTVDAGRTTVRAFQEGQRSWPPGARAPVVGADHLERRSERPRGRASRVTS